MMLKSNLVVALFILAVVALTVEGYYVYRFYEEAYRSPNSGQTALAESPEAEQENTAALDPTFVHRAEPANISANSTYLDHPTLNSNPDAIISVTHNWNPGGGPGTYNDHAVGVWYDADRERWAIFNQGREAMPQQAAFNVALPASAEK